MSKSSPTMREIARALQRANRATATEEPGSYPLVHDNLRHSLTKFVGAEGYASLLRRSVSLTRGSIPALRAAEVHKDGRIQGLGETFKSDATAGEEAAIAVTTQLLELLVTFLGEPLTRRLVREACPDALPGE